MKTIKATKVLEFCLKSNRRFLIHQGSSRSSKTWSIIQYIIYKCLTEKNKVYSIVRKTLPALKASAMRDFVEQLRQMGLYDEANHNKTDGIYILNSNTIEFLSVDQPAKIRGRKRDVLFVNECNELFVEDFRQLEMRTTEKIILDFNPSESFGWHYDIIEQRPDEVDFLISTYKDNPFLEESIVRSIESHRETDPDYFRVFGLGERGFSKSNIYTAYQTFSGDPDGLEFAFGLDFGYNHPTALTKVFFGDGKLYVKECVYESHLTTQELIEKIKQYVGKNDVIWADAANPEGIETIRRAGFNIKSASKDVKPGIDLVKSHKLFIHKDSKNLLKEVQLYRWKEVNGNPIDEPVKMHDDACDSFRYAVFNHLKGSRTSKFDYDFKFL